MSLSRTGEFTLLLVATLTIMVGAALAPGLNPISVALGVSEYATLLITLPALGAIIFAPFFGRLIDRYSARSTLLLSLLGYFVLGAGGVFLDGAFWVGIDRILLGGFAAGAMAAGTAMISLWYTGKARLGMIAKQGMAIELGGVVFLFAGGLLTELAWQAPFVLYALGFLCAILVWFFVPATVIDNDENNLQAVPVGVASIRSIVVCSTLAMALFFSMFITLPQLLTSLDFSESQIGYLLSFISLVAVFSAMLMPKVVARVSERMTLVLAFLSYAVAHAVFASSALLAPLVAAPVIIISLIVASTFAGLGFGLSIPLLNHATVESSNSQNLGRNLSFFAMAVFTGQFLTSAIEFLPLPLGNILYLCALLALVCALLLMFMQPKKVFSTV